MQVAQTVFVRVVDDYCVGIRNIQSCLDNRGTQQHVVLAVDEVEHYLFELVAFHLTVTYSHLRARHAADNHVVDLHDVLDAVMHEKHLSVARELILDGVADDVGSE